MADGLRRETRQVDALSRLGGDEFAVLYPGSLRDAELVAHRALPDRLDLAKPRATLSVGVAEGDADADFESLWHAADAAMYEMAHRGRLGQHDVVDHRGGLRGLAEDAERTGAAAWSPPLRTI